MNMQHLTPNFPRNSDAGFTLIESLLAVVVVAILLVSIGPIVAFSAATRVQSRRVELGIQAARGYISAVQSGAVVAPPIWDVGAGNPISLELKNTDVPDGAANLTCNANSYCTAPVDTTRWALYCVDQDGGGCTTDSPKDFVIQAFGVQPNQDPALANNYNNNDAKQALERPNIGYNLGIRVYRANAFAQNPRVDLKSSASPTTTGETKARIVTSGLGSRSLPIVEMTTDVSNSATDYQDYCNRLNRDQSCN